LSFDVHRSVSLYIDTHSHHPPLHLLRISQFTTLTNPPRHEAKSLLQAQAESDPSEIEYLLEYYSLVREGKTNYISTLAFNAVTGQQPQEPVEFFKIYADEFKAEHLSKRQKKK
jgi:hypothetical protein